MRVLVGSDGGRGRGGWRERFNAEFE